MQAGPTYLLCTGATKAGTSWLYDHLAAHPECHFRTIKELHYFTMTTPAHFENALRAGRDEISRLKDATDLTGSAKDWHDRRLTDLRDWQKVLRAKTVDLQAYTAFLNDGRANARVVGDITPAYALMSGDRLKSVLTVGADVRVIYLIRDPVARLWSHVRMIAQRAAPQRFAQEAVALMGRILAGDLTGEAKGIVARGDYAAILPKLARSFDPARLLVMFYEDMLTVAGIARLSAFLGIAPAPADLGRKIHEGPSLALDPAIAVRARDYLKPHYSYVANQFADIPQAWRKNMIEGVA